MSKKNVEIESFGIEMPKKPLSLVLLEQIEANDGTVTGSDLKIENEVQIRTCVLKSMCKHGFLSKSVLDEEANGTLKITDDGIGEMYRLQADYNEAVRSYKMWEESVKDRAETRRIARRNSIISIAMMAIALASLIINIIFRSK